MREDRVISTGTYKHVFLRSVQTPYKYTEGSLSEDDYHAISPEWKHLESNVFIRDKFRCRVCGSATFIVAHHLRYPELWGEETEDDLITLCTRCHKKAHEEDINRKKG